MTALDDVNRSILPEWLIVLRSLPDPPPNPDVGELAALNIIAVASKMVQNEVARESIQHIIAPLLEASTKQLNRRIAASGIQVEALTTPSGSIGLGSLPEWDLLAMVLLANKHSHGILHTVKE